MDTHIHDNSYSGATGVGGGDDVGGGLQVRRRDGRATAKAFT